MTSVLQSGHNTLHQHLLIAGAPKAGSTSLFRYLTAHPMICPSNRKETYFFAREFDYKGVCSLETSRTAYDTYFTHCDDPTIWRVEGTPYTLYSKAAVSTIKSVIPGTSLLFILRDPIARFISNYQFAIQRENPHVRGPIEDYLKQQLSLTRDIPGLLEIGCYNRYLRPFFENFERDKITVMFFEELIADPLAEMNRLCQKLEIGSEIYEQYSFSQYNRTVNIRSPRLNRLMMTIEPFVAGLRVRLLDSPRLYKVFDRVVSIGKSASRSLNDRGRNRKEVISDEVIARLAAYYHPYNLALAERLGRSLPWKSAYSPVTTSEL